MKLIKVNLLLFSLCIIAMVDTIFLYKYGSRVIGGYTLFTVIVAYVICRYGVVYLIYKQKIGDKLWLIIVLIFVLISIAIFVFIKIDPSQSHVDRWDAVVFWWDAVYEGKFPYSIRTRRDGFPSPLPILQLICYPFYQIGELGISILFSVLVMLYFVYRSFQQKQFVFLILFLITSSTAFWWEISVRSTLFINGLLILILSVKLFQTDVKNSKSIVIAGILIGLILSTRMVVAIPILVFLGNKLNLKSLYNFCVLGIISVLTFGLTFAPLILGWGFGAFLENNPILHHDRHMPHVFSIVLFLAALLIGFVSKKIENYIFSVGLLLVCSATIFILFGIIEYGFEIAILENNCDISYYILSYPCLLYCIVECLILKSDYSGIKQQTI